MKIMAEKVIVKEAFEEHVICYYILDSMAYPVNPVLLSLITRLV